MKRASLIVGAVLFTLVTTPVWAAGLNARWGQCEGDGGVQNLNFACDTNTGNRQLACSFTLDTDMHDVLAGIRILHVSTASSTLAQWWELRSNAPQGFVACRNGSISIAALNGPSCPDLFALQASLGISAYTVGLPGPNSARIFGVNAVPSTSPFQLLAADNPSRTWGIARFFITNLRTTGTPSCTACTTPACIVFSSLELHSVGDLEIRLITGPAAPGSDYVTWQGGGGTNCPAATPTKNATWGTVKSLYR